MNPLLLSFLDNISIGEIATGIIGLFVLIWAVRFAVPTQIASSTNSLLEKRTVERDDALRERDASRKEVLELEELTKVYRREIIQRADINQQDQETIRELKAELAKANAKL